MTVKFIPVTTEEQIDTLARVAGEIWLEYWPAIIGEAQTEYMVNKFQTRAAIADDMANHGYEYWLVVDAQEETPIELAERSGEMGRDVQGDTLDASVPYAVESEKDGAIAGEVRDAARTLDEAMILGYTGGHVEPETNRYFISKIYLYDRHRGHHYGSMILRFYDRLCRDRGLQAMYLTVNKHNDLAIRAYEAKGFTTIEAVETDIGEGYIMDDFIMEKKA